MTSEKIQCAEIVERCCQTLVDEAGSARGRAGVRRKCR